MTSGGGNLSVLCFGCFISLAQWRSGHDWGREKRTVCAENRTLVAPSSSSLQNDRYSNSDILHYVTCKRYFISRCSCMYVEYS